MPDQDLWDLHLHSHYSWDTPNDHDLNAICTTALERGLRGVALTDHFDSHPGDGVTNRRTTGMFDIADMLLDVARAREAFPRLGILVGLEYGEPHLNTSQARTVRHDHPLDLVLGSVHAIVVDGELVPVEAALARQHVSTTMRRYLWHVLDMVEESPIDVLAHIEYPLRHPNEGGYQPERDAELYTQIFTTAAARGISVEYNTKSATPLLHQLWPIIAEVDDVTFTVGSDAHGTEIIGHGFDEATDLLARQGFSGCRRFTGRLCRHGGCQ
jgi:histidinol-phosphatase (PHP family)